MKKLLFGLTLLVSISSVDASPMKSIALEGNYQLIKASSDDAKQYHCSKEIEITVDETAVILKGLNDNTSYAAFWSDNTGCESQSGDIGPLRVTCTKFNKKSVSNSLTEPVTIVGYVREYKKISLNKKGKLIFKNNVTAIPFGILGIGKDDEFKCEYQRVVSQ